MDRILMKPPDKVSSELEAMKLCSAVNSLTTSKLSSEQEIRLIGIVNLHQKECKDSTCPLSDSKDLYDPSQEKFVGDGDTENLHKNQVFLKLFTKYYFDTAISNFSSTSGIRLTYAYFLFHEMKNIHAALNELSHAKRNKPNIMQNFEIYKFE